MEDNLTIVQTATPSVVYDDSTPVTVTISVTNNTSSALSDITVTSDYSAVGTLDGTATLNGTATTDPASGIAISSLAVGETAVISYEITPTNLTADRQSTITTTSSGSETAASASASSTVYISPYTRYASVSTSICTESIGCIEEVYVEEQPVAYSTGCESTVICKGVVIGMKYTDCMGNPQTAKRRETAVFTVPTASFSEDNLTVSVENICTSCRDYAQCVTVNLSASFAPTSTT